MGRRMALVAAMAAAARLFAEPVSASAQDAGVTALQNGMAQAQTQLRQTPIEGAVRSPAAQRAVTAADSAEDSEPAPADAQRRARTGWGSFHASLICAKMGAAPGPDLIVIQEIRTRLAIVGWATVLDAGNLTSLSFWVLGGLNDLSQSDSPTAVIYDSSWPGADGAKFKLVLNRAESAPNQHLATLALDNGAGSINARFVCRTQ